MLALMVGCTDYARVYPLDETTAKMGMPKVEFVRQGLGHGPITITMPDGEIIKGEYQIAENAAVGMGVAGGRLATAVTYGSGRHFVGNGVGDRGTISACEGVVDIGGHGFGDCQDSRGAKYRIMF